MNDRDPDSLKDRHRGGATASGQGPTGTATPSYPGDRRVSFLADVPAAGYAEETAQPHQQNGELMSLAWSADIANSEEVARGIAVLQRSAAHDAEVWDRALSTARGVAELGPIGEWVLIGEVTRRAHVSESLASNAVWQLCDEGVLNQDFETSVLTVAD